MQAIDDIKQTSADRNVLCWNKCLTCFIKKCQISQNKSQYVFGGGMSFVFTQAESLDISFQLNNVNLQVYCHKLLYIEYI